MVFDRRHPTTLRPEFDMEQYYEVNALNSEEAIGKATKMLQEANQDNHLHIRITKAVERKFDAQPETD